MTSLADAGSWDWQQGCFDRGALGRSKWAGATGTVIQLHVQLHPAAGNTEETLTFLGVTSHPFSLPQLSKVSASQSHISLPLGKVRKVRNPWAQGVLALVTGAQEDVLKVGFKPASTNRNSSSVLAAGCLCGTLRWVRSARWILEYRAEMLNKSHISKNWALS